jgi:hypothetical protein
VTTYLEEFDSIQPEKGSSCLHLCFKWFCLTFDLWGSKRKSALVKF